MGEHDDKTGMSADLQKRVDAGMGCGSYIMDGWRDIVLQLNEDIAKLDPDYRVDQIKEKFGGLRYYITTTNNEARDAIRDLVNEAENKSMETCDVCGKDGKRATQNRGFVAVRCEKHSN